MNREDKRAARRDASRASKVEGTAAPVKTEGRTSPAQFLREVRQELRKVNWPSRPQVISYTMVVLVVTLALTLLTWGVDWLISNAVLNVFG